MSEQTNKIISLFILFIVLGGLIVGITTPGTIMHDSIVSTPWYLHAIGGVSLCAALYVLYKLIKSEWEGIAYIIAIAVLLIFSLSAFMGFGNYLL
jgi:hypothetical protein